MPISYKLKQLNEEDPMDSVIEKTGHVVEFSMTQVNANKKIVEKSMRELESQKAHEEAKMKNIEEHHEFVQNMTEFELATASMYYDAKVMAKACAEKLVELIEQTKKDDAEVEEILRQVPELSLVPSKKLDESLPTPPEAPVEAVQPEAEATAIKQTGEEVPVSEAIATPENGEAKSENNG